MVAGTLGTRALPPEEVGENATCERPDLAEVYEAEFRYVWRCLRSLGVRDAFLDDALQDVFVVVQRKLAQFDGRAKLRTWLFAIAIRIARKYRIRSSKEPSPLDPEASGEACEASAFDVEKRAHDNQQLILARAALEALDEEKREVFVLARVEQMSAPEIAEVIGIPVNTVYSRLRAARLAFEAEVRRLNAARSKR